VNANVPKDRKAIIYSTYNCSIKVITKIKHMILSHRASEDEIIEN